VKGTQSGARGSGAGPGDQGFGEGNARFQNVQGLRTSKQKKATFSLRSACFHEGWGVKKEGT
jgi:hypothetical protein